MREIKFRYILKHKGKIKTIYATLEQIEQGFLDEYLMPKSAKFRKDDEIIAKNQYTGLKDKNDKEIYDGDIVQYTNCFGDKKDAIGKKMISKINWDEEDACFVSGIVMLSNYFVGNGDIEIIGNIYENLKLLK